MSDVPLGEGWWIASDGRWYPPSSHPDALAQLPLSADPNMPPAEGWWKASDGNWYVPELHPDNIATIALSHRPPRAAVAAHPDGGAGRAGHPLDLPHSANGHAPGMGHGGGMAGGYGAPLPTTGSRHGSERPPDLDPRIAPKRPPVAPVRTAVTGAGRRLLTNGGAAGTSGNVPEPYNEFEIPGRRGGGAGLADGRGVPALPDAHGVPLRLEHGFLPTAHSAEAEIPEAGITPAGFVTDHALGEEHDLGHMEAGSAAGYSAEELEYEYARNSDLAAAGDRRSPVDRRMGAPDPRPTAPDRRAAPLPRRVAAGDPPRSRPSGTPLVSTAAPVPGAEPRPPAASSSGPPGGDLPYDPLNDPATLFGDLDMPARPAARPSPPPAPPGQPQSPQPSSLAPPVRRRPPLPGFAPSDTPPPGSTRHEELPHLAYGMQGGGGMPRQDGFDDWLRNFVSDPPPRPGRSAPAQVRVTHAGDSLSGARGTLGGPASAIPKVSAREADFFVLKPSGKRPKHVHHKQRTKLSSALFLTVLLLVMVAGAVTILLIHTHGHLHF